ncbi:rhodanese-like domain-containing protein [Ideonella sp.]|uniref:rhodanese-like domain-containing protein n=1 Tax=Ideonella sp. TaxID=1929293 RepID=UPI002B464946|nr:rhodanese-like domain-containing protein [Ideonella sp.]HJV72062.1 rhodanese-like domain-containing protein [Ideonella sp.]
MSFLIENWIPAVMALVSGALLLWPVLQRGAQGGAISPSEAVRLINREKAVVIDVCEPAEYAAGHVAGSRSIPLGTLEGSKDLPSNKTLPLVVVCASGMRASRAAGTLRKAGYANAQVLAGGLKAWREANLPVEASRAA